MASSRFGTAVFLVCIVSWCGSAVAQNHAEGQDPDVEARSLAPTVVVAFFARNKEYALPWFLGCLDRLDFPKERIALWIRTDHNIDRSADILQQWTDGVRPLYHSINFEIGPGGGYPDERGPTHWSAKRMDHVIALRQEALDTARRMSADYLFLLDCDAFLLNPRVLNLLIAQRRTIIAPMLNTTDTYSNFWGAMAPNGYYERSEDYLDIVSGHILGAFPVPMVHSAVLITVNHRIMQGIQFSPAPSNLPARNPDDIIQFAISARNAGVNMFILNVEFFGLLPRPSESDDSIEYDSETVTFLKLHAIVDDYDTRLSTYVKLQKPNPSKLGFDEIYFINLDRRPDRKLRMFASFEELGIEGKRFPAVDGRQLNDSYLEALGVRQLEGYEDPYHKRPLKIGEIGCFLSHYFIWKEAIERNYSKIIIFEDDVRFGHSFVPRLRHTLNDIKRLGYDEKWELLFLGRKIMGGDKWLDGYALAWPGYTYWAIGYAMTNTGIRKLLAQQPLEKLVPVDEFLPIMFDKHDRPDWMEHFKPRDLVALAAHPVLLAPMRYVGDNKYVSDTENSTIITSEPPETEQPLGEPEDNGPEVHSVDARRVEL